MSELLMSQLAATNMVYKKFSFDYFLDSMDRLGVHRLELYGCSHHFHMYDQYGCQYAKKIVSAGI